MVTPGPLCSCAGLLLRACARICQLQLLLPLRELYSDTLLLEDLTCVDVDLVRGIIKGRVDQQMGDTILLCFESHPLPGGPGAYEVGGADDSTCATTKLCELEPHAVVLNGRHGHEIPTIQNHDVRNSRCIFDAPHNANLGDWRLLALLAAAEAYLDEAPNRAVSLQANDVFCPIAFEDLNVTDGRGLKQVLDGH